MYRIFYKLDPTDKTAPSKVSLTEDYEDGGEVKAATRSEAIRKWFLGKEEDFGHKPRPPEIGDVLVDPANTAYIFTPQGLWAQVSYS